uniref:glycosyltransferase n=1 Tax=Treponema sp. TaxID=166 RepID=UPI00298E286D
FVFPSYYEGFGIPPLEALSEGTKIIVSKSASLPEIYGNAASYIAPDSTDVSLEELSKNEPAPQDVKSVLEKYTYRNAAKLLLKELS